MKVGDIIQRDQDGLITIGVVRVVECHYGRNMYEPPDYIVRADFVTYFSDGRLNMVITDHPVNAKDVRVLVQATGEPEAERPNEPASPGSPLPEEVSQGLSGVRAVVERFGSTVKCQEHI